MYKNVVYTCGVELMKTIFSIYSLYFYEWQSSGVSAPALMRARARAASSTVGSRARSE